MSPRVPVRRGDRVALGCSIQLLGGEADAAGEDDSSRE